MIPRQLYSVDYTTIVEKNQPSRTYKLNTIKGEISGFVDGTEAVKQAVLLALNTERYKHCIYSWNYGSEVNSTIGEDFQLAQSNVKRYIKEALLQDERITDVDGFEFDYGEHNTMMVRFTVYSIFGEIEVTL